MHPRKSLDIWYHYDRDGYALKNQVKATRVISNQQLNVMWKRVMHLHETARFLDHLNRILPRSHQFIVNYYHADQQFGLLDRSPPHVSFTEDEEERGLAGLRDMGIGPDDKFVCFHARDSAYLDTARPRNEAAFGDWSNSDDRDASIENYIPAAQKLTELGYFAVRIGKYVKEPIHSNDPRIIDYATHFQSDFMDVFLAARCTFFLGQNSGMANLFQIFRKPVVFANVHPLHDIPWCQYEKGIMIPRKYYSTREGRNLTYREVLEAGLGVTNLANAEFRALVDDFGLIIVENTPEEICEVASEMHLKLQSDFSAEEDTMGLQARFKSILRAYPDMVPGLADNSRLTIGNHFLITHQKILE